MQSGPGRPVDGRSAPVLLTDPGGVLGRMVSEQPRGHRTGRFGRRTPEVFL